MQERLKELQEEAIQKIEQSVSLKELNDIRVAYLGKKGPITEVLRGLGQLSADERRVMGALANEVREAIAVKIEAKHTGLEEAAVLEKLASESIDVTLPGRPVKVGNHHPLTRIIEEIEDLFIGMGYQVA
ncbi:MAG: phenylalanine--tRNA ligase subunit alpha, partial [Bacillus sp. (in: firmicutes)]